MSELVSVVSASKEPVQAVVIRDGSGSSLPGLDKGTGQPNLDRAYKANVSFKEGTKTPADEFSG